MPQKMEKKKEKYAGQHWEKYENKWNIYAEYVKCARTYENNMKIIWNTLNHIILILF